jgi:transposase InsO family protein
MLFKIIGVFTEAHAFMRNSKIKASAVEGARVVRLMQAMNICASRKRRKAYKTDSNHNNPFAPNLLKQDFTADAPNKKWMTDMTFIETQEG